MTSTSAVSARRRLVRVSVVLVLLLPLATCTRWQKVYYGVEYSTDGTRLQVASPGSCGCVTLQNRSDETLTLYASLHDGLVGQLVLKADEMTRVRYDWAGPLGDDFYEIVAVRGPATAQTLAAPLRNYLAAEGVVDTPCDGRACDYGALSMNKAAVQRAGDQEAQALVQGVGFTKGDEVLEVAAPRGQCGCMLLRNISDTPVILRSALRGHIVGGLTLDARLPRQGASGTTAQIGGLLTGPQGPHADPYSYTDRYVGFDWAGDLNQDVYEVTAVAPPGLLDEPLGADQASSTGASAVTGTQSGAGGGVRAAAVDESDDRPLKIKDYIALVGRMDAMQCAPRVSREARVKKVQEFVSVYKAAFPAFDANMLERMADYSAGVPNTQIPVLDTRTHGDLLRKLDQARAQNADGALFVLPTGDEIRCPFGDLNLGQVWQTEAPTAPAPAAPAAPPTAGGTAGAPPPATTKGKVP